MTKSAIKRETESFIQIIHKFRDESLLKGHRPPIDRIAIFDESQRAWNEEKLTKFMREKKDIADLAMSEPQCLIEYMDRHEGWAAIVCLVGGGQEIHEGEAGIGEWFRALEDHFPRWCVFCSDRMAGDEYVGRDTIARLSRAMKVEISPELHLSVSMRSFRSESVSAFAKALIDGDADAARDIYREISALDETTGDVRYPVVMTRDIDAARAWVRRMSRGSERYGIIASSGAKRLRADGIDVSVEIKVEKWFLNGPDDVNSSYFMEVAATEFQIQGLEIDWAAVAWEADYRYVDGEFVHRAFSGSSWKEIRARSEQEYLKNSYRVLLTRARPGFAIYVPRGSVDDDTRRPEFYDGLYEYLRGVGIREI